MRIDVLLLGAILGAVIFVPAGYIIRVWLSSAAESVGRSPCVDEIYNFLDGLRRDVDQLRSGVGSLPETIQLMESKLRLMDTEMADFFEKTRKSEERARGHARRVEAAMGDEEGTSEQDQQLLALMEAKQQDLPFPEQEVFDSPEAYYAAQRARLGQ